MKNDKSRALAFVLWFLLSVIPMTSVVAQQRIVGVNEGNWFKYSVTTVNMPVPGLNETEWILMRVEDISGTNITFQETRHLKNGTEETFSGYIDIDTGRASATSFLWVVSANLDANDTIYASPVWSTWKINETIVRTYPDGIRETNHISTNTTWISNETQLNTSFYWDRPTGIIVEGSVETRNQTGEDLTTWWSIFIKIAESNVLVIPEFPTWASMLLILIVLTVAVAIHKRRLLKTPVC